METRTLHILVVDDDEVDRMSIQRALRRTSLKIEVDEADDGLAGIEALEHKKYDCIFLDYRLPGMDGLEVLEKIRVSGVRAPVIILTGQGGEQIAVDIMKAGATDYIVKDFISPELFEKSLKYAVSVHEAQEEVRMYQRNLEKLVEERTVELKSTQDRLIKLSHSAGMAEVATSVLHNVGNVLNSVKVASSLIRESLEQSKLPGLAKAMALVEEHERDLGRFFDEDPKGAKLILYIKTLAKNLEAEQKRTLERLDDLSEKIGHIESIVSLQQSYAKAGGVLEECRLADLVDDSLQVNATGLRTIDAIVHREYADIPPFPVDKHKVMLILVNLIGNAIHAMAEAAPKQPELLLRILEPTPGTARIEVQDNGAGIPPENLVKVFAHGFTTRKNGHGFGLHSSALAARDIKGRLDAHSEGPGRGARFTLDIPARRP